MPSKKKAICTECTSADRIFLSLPFQVVFMEDLEKRNLGRTGGMVTCVGLGGEGVLRTYGKSREASAVIKEAKAQGITYWDSARAYAGSEIYYGSFWKEHEKERPYVIQTSKSARRDHKGALADLQTSLSLMHTSTLDLWQIHDVRTWEDIRDIEAPGVRWRPLWEQGRKGASPASE
jgi:aryl-alcohol dehydrogenase-like predicted oxidoreductase